MFFFPQGFLSVKNNSNKINTKQRQPFNFNFVGQVSALNTVSDLIT